MSADCDEKQFDFFTTLVLDFSLYLGFTLLTIMIGVGLYFFLKYCCCKRCRKRWVGSRQDQTRLIRREILIFSCRHAFSGIRSQPSFVATIQFAFSSNLTTFTEIGSSFHPIKLMLEMSLSFPVPAHPQLVNQKVSWTKNFMEKIFWNLNKTTSQDLVRNLTAHIIFHFPVAARRWLNKMV